MISLQVFRYLWATILIFPFYRTSDHLIAEWSKRYMYVAFVYCKHNSSKHSCFKIDVLANMFIITLRYDLYFYILFRLFVVRNSRKTKKSLQIWYSILKFYQALSINKERFRMRPLGSELSFERLCYLIYLDHNYDHILSKSVCIHLRLYFINICVQKFLCSSALRQYDMIQAKSKPHINEKSDRLFFLKQSENKT